MYMLQRDIFTNVLLIYFLPGEKRTPDRYARFRHRDHRRFRKPYRSRGKATIFPTRKVLASGPVPYARGYVSIVTVASIVSRHAGLAGWLGDLSETALVITVPHSCWIHRFWVDAESEQITT